MQKASDPLLDVGLDVRRAIERDDADVGDDVDSHVQRTDDADACRRHVDVVEKILHGSQELDTRQRLRVAGARDDDHADARRRSSATGRARRRRDPTAAHTWRARPPARRAARDLRSLRSSPRGRRAAPSRGARSTSRSIGSGVGAAGRGLVVRHLVHVRHGGFSWTIAPGGRLPACPPPIR